MTFGQEFLLWMETSPVCPDIDARLEREWEAEQTGRARSASQAPADAAHDARASHAFADRGQTMKTSDDDYDYKMKSAKAQAADDAALVKNAKEAYAEVSTAAERRAGFIGQRQKLAKLIVTKWLEPPLGPAARALKTLADVPLSIESNCTWMYDRSLAEAINAALQADAQADTDRLNEGPAPYANDDPKDKRFKTLAEYQANQAARAVMYDANRVEPDPENIARVARAIKEIGED
jgi:hypothetical protein